MNGEGKTSSLRHWTAASIGSERTVAPVVNGQWCRRRTTWAPRWSESGSFSNWSWFVFRTYLVLRYELPSTILFVHTSLLTKWLQYREERNCIPGEVHAHGAHSNRWHWRGVRGWSWACKSSEGTETSSSRVLCQTRIAYTSLLKWGSEVSLAVLLM